MERERGACVDVAPLRWGERGENRNRGSCKLRLIASLLLCGKANGMDAHFCRRVAEEQSGRGWVCSDDRESFEIVQPTR
jgi:hypothetical protein